MHGACHYVTVMVTATKTKPRRRRTTTDVIMLTGPIELHLTGCARAYIMSRRMGENGGWMRNWNCFVLENLCSWMWSLEVEKYLHIVFNNCTPYMRASGLKPSYVGKLVVHTFDSWKCKEFLCKIPKNFDPICAGGHLSETWMLETLLPFYQSAWCHIPEDHNLQQSGMLSNTYSISFSMCVFLLSFITGLTHSVIFLFYI